MTEMEEFEVLHGKKLCVGDKVTIRPCDCPLLPGNALGVFCLLRREFIFHPQPDDLG